MSSIIANKVEQETQQIVIQSQDTAAIVSDTPKNPEIPPPKSNFVLKSEGGLDNVARQLTERFYPFQSTEWYSTSPSGSILATYNLPGDLFAKSRIPNMAYLSNYAYWHADLKFRCEITAPKMAYGAITISYCYGYAGMSLKEQNLRTHITSLNQMHKVIADVSTNNKVEIFIPYKSYKTYGNTINSTTYDSLQSMVTVFISVLAPLRTSVNALAKVRIETYVSLENLSLSGIQIKPQMLSLVEKFAERMLDTYFPDPNRDNPTNVSAPTQVVLRNSQALCYGSNSVEITQPLRLFNGVTTPFPFDDDDELKVDYLMNREGLFTTFDIVAEKSGVLHSFHVTPIPSMHKDYIYKSDGQLDLIGCPPISVISSFASRWRGQIKYTFVIPHNQFTVGKMIVAYIPTYADVSDVEDLKSSYHTIFELESSNVFTFQTPYIAQTPFKKVSCYNDRTTTSGKIVIAMYSPLQITGVSGNMVSCYVFISKGDQYELAVPSPSIYGLGTDRRTGVASDYLVPADGYNPVYLSTWRYFSGRYIFRYGPGTDHIAQFDKDTRKAVWKSETMHKLILRNGDNAYYVEVEYFTCPSIGDGYYYLAPLLNKAAADLVTKNGPKWEYFVQARDGFEQQTYFDIGAWKITKYADIKLTANSGETIPEVKLSNQLQQMSILQYGENITDMKDVMRRYGMYGQSQLTIEPSVSQNYVLFSVPVHFRATPIKPGDLTNPKARLYTREGVIPIMASAFYLGRGSLRFKLIFSTPKDSGIVVGVYHDPNCEINIPSIIAGDNKFNINTFVDGGYAGVVQDLKTNSIIDIEVPYYKTTEYMVLPHVSNIEAKDAIYNGSIKVVAVSKPQTKFDLTLTVMYSFGDDTRFFVYNGFIPMIQRNLIGHSKPKAALLKQVKGVKYDFTKLAQPGTSINDFELVPKKDSKDSAVDLDDKDVVKVEAQSGIMSTLLGLPDKNKIEQAADSITETSTSIGNVTKQVEEIIENMKSMLPSGEDNERILEIMMKTLISMSHLLTSRSYQTIATILAQFLVEIKILTYKTVTMFIEFMVKSYNWAMKRFFPSELPQETSSNGVPVVSGNAIQPEAFTEDELTSIITLGLTSMSGIIGYNLCKDPKGIFNNLFVRDIKEFSQTSNSLMTLFKAHWSLVKKFVAYIRYYTMPDESKCLSALEEDAEAIKAWYKQAAFLTDGINKNMILADRAYCTEVFLIKQYGDGIQTAIAGGSTIAPKQSFVINEMMKKINTLYNEIIDNCMAPLVRLEPMCIQLYGSTKLGKSYLLDYLNCELLKALKVETSDPMFTITSGNKYWNRCKNQPSCCFDDFLQIQEETSVAETVSSFFSLCSTQPFNPLIAELENKKVYYNPMFVFLTSNLDFFNGVTTCTADITALHRRRDVLIKVTICDEVKGEDGLMDIKKVNEYQEKNGKFSHCQFFINKNPGSKQPSEYGDAITYKQLLDLLIKKAKQHFAYKKIEYTQRLAMFTSLMPEAVPSVALEEYRSTFINLLAKQHKKIDASIKSTLITSQDGTSDYLTEYQNRFNKGTIADQINKVVSPEQKVDIAQGVLYQDDSFLKYLYEIVDTSIYPSEAYSDKLKTYSERVLFLANITEYVNNSFNEYDSDQVGLNQCVKHEFIDSVNDISPSFDRRTATYNYVPIHHEESECVSSATLEPCSGPCYVKDKLRMSDFVTRMWNQYFRSAILEERYSEVDINLVYFLNKFVNTDNCNWKSLLLFLKSSPKTTLITPTVPKIITSYKEKMYRNLNALKLTAKQSKDYLAKIAGTIWDFVRRWWRPVSVGLLAGLIIFKGVFVGATSEGSVGSKFATGLHSVATDLRECGEDFNRTRIGLKGWKFVFGNSVYEGVKHSAPRARKLQITKQAMKATQGHRAAVHDKYYSGESSSPDTLIRLVSNNTCVLKFTKDRIGCPVICNATGIFEKFVITAGHFIEDLENEYSKHNKDLLLYVNVANSGFVATRFGDCEIIRDSENSSLAILRLPKRIPSFRDIRHFIATIDDHDNIAPHDSEIIDFIDKTIIRRPVTVGTSEAVLIKGTEDYKEFTLSASYTYDFARMGMCGSSLISLTPKPRIIGIHIAGNGTNVGYAEPIANEAYIDLEIAPNAFAIQENPKDNADANCKVQISPKGTFIESNVIKDPIPLPTKSKFEKTPMFNVLPGCETTSRPALLHPTKLFRNKDGTYHEQSPLEAGISKHGNPPIPFPSEMLEKSRQHLSKKLIAVCPPLLLNREPELKDHEIFEGIPGIKECKGIELHTSEGEPLIRFRKKEHHNKAWCFKFNEDQNEGTRKFLGFHEQFEKQINENMRLRKLGIIPNTVFMVSLKDALVSEKKYYQEGGTRVFSVSPLEYTWVIKKYFGEFQMSYIHNRIKSETTVGINPDSIEWTQLFRFLNEVQCNDENGNPRYVTGDYKAFGDTLQSECIVAAFEIMIDWYKHYYNIDAEGIMIRRLLCQELLNSITQGLNVQYKKFCGIHSGFALTVEVNSLVNSLYFRCAWLDQGLPLEYFTTHVRLNCYGDDCISKVSKDYVGKYNFNSIKNFLAKYNILFTPASKEQGSSPDTITLDEVTYLKRGFSRCPKDPMIVLAPIDKKSIYQTLNWYRKNVSKTVEDILPENCRAAMTGAFSLGPEFYEELRQKIQTFYTRKYHSEFHCKTWDEEYERCFSM